MTCTDARSAWVCRGGHLVAARCLGTAGCTARGELSTCDNGIREEGEACAEVPEKPAYGCSADLAHELVCRGRRVELLRTCRGPRGCLLEGETVGCDDSLAEIGDACLPRGRDRFFACSVDAKTELVCDPSTKKMGLDRVCRGATHCRAFDGRVTCDQSIAVEGEPCRPAHNHACAEGAAIELECSDKGTWTKQRDCKAGCEVLGQRDVYCR